MPLPEPPEYRPLEVGADYRNALVSRNRALTEAADKDAQEQDRFVKQLAQGALLRIAPAAFNQIVSGVKVDYQDGKKQMEAAQEARRMAMQARQRADELALVLPAETDVQLAEMRANLDSQNQRTQDDRAMDLYRLQADQAYTPSLQC